MFETSEYVQRLLGCFWKCVFIAQKSSDFKKSTRSSRFSRVLGDALLKKSKPLTIFALEPALAFLHVRKPTILECGIQQLTPPGNHMWRMYTCKPFLDTPHFDSFTERHAGSQRKTSNNLKLHMFHLLVSSPGPSLAAIHLFSFHSFFQNNQTFHLICFT